MPNAHTRHSVAAIVLYIAQFFPLSLQYTTLWHGLCAVQRKEETFLQKSKKAAKIFTTDMQYPNKHWAYQKRKFSGAILAKWMPPYRCLWIRVWWTLQSTTLLGQREGIYAFPKLQRAFPIAKHLETKLYNIALQKRWRTSLNTFPTTHIPTQSANPHLNPLP